VSPGPEVRNPRIDSVANGPQLDIRAAALAAGPEPLQDFVRLAAVPIAIGGGSLCWYNSWQLRISPNLESTSARAPKSPAEVCAVAAQGRQCANARNLSRRCVSEDLEGSNFLYRKLLKRPVIPMFGGWKPFGESPSPPPRVSVVPNRGRSPAPWNQ
jgi:hypothetical protein